MSTQRNAIQTVSKQLLHSAYWLVQYSKKKRLEEELRLMYLKTKPGLRADAIWAGHSAVRDVCSFYVDQIKACGGLLFMGSAVALAEAKTHERFLLDGGEQA